MLLALKKISAQEALPPALSYFIIPATIPCRLNMFRAHFVMRRL